LVRWSLPIDGVCTKRGGEPLVENATKYRLRRQGRRHGRPLAHKTQVDLACLIVKELELPGRIRLVVLAEE
jgi:hypothetical protein